MASLTLEIPDDVVFSILSKLPLKSLRRLLFTCKSWAFLLEDPYFMSRFRRNFIYKHHSYYDDTYVLLVKNLGRSMSNHSVMYLLTGERFENKIKLDWPPPFQDDDKNINILGSGINGVLCLYKLFGEIVLWNLATEKFRIISPYLAPQVSRVRILDEPCGFGYDHIGDDYKVIRYVYFDDIAYYEDDCEDEPIIPNPFWEVYSLKSNSWRKILVDIPFYCTGNDIYMNGVCHWWGYSKFSNYDAHLVSFNLSSETFITTPLPLDLCTKCLKHLSVLSGFIGMISYLNDMSTFHIHVLSELGVKESWTKIFSVGPLSFVDHPIGTGKNSDIFFKKYNEELTVFDMGTQMIEKIGFKGEKDDGSCKIVIYKKVFFSLSEYID